MLALLLSILFSSLVILLFRLFESYRVDELGAITFNYLVAASMGFAVWYGSDFISGLPEKEWLLPALVIGVLFILVYLIMSRSAAISGITITAVASRMSVLIPVSAGFFLFHDTVSFQKLAGIALAMVSFYFVLKPSGRSSLDPKKVWLPVLLLVGIGMNDTAMKYLQQNFFNGDESQFLTVVFVVSLVFGSFILLRRTIRTGKWPHWTSFPAGAALGLLNFGSTYYLLLAMSAFESSVLFPVVNMGIVILSAILGLVFFREKPGALNWLGILMAIIAIFLITSGNQVYGHK